MRGALFAAALLGATFVLVAWAAGMQWSSPLLTQERLTLAGSTFRVVMGGAAEDEDRLRIGAVGDDRTALQSVVLNGLEADAYPILRYRFEQFPHTLELSLVFRRADASDDVHVVSLPWPGDGNAWFDLGTVPEWHGRIVEIGFAEYPTPQIVQPMQGFRPFTLVGAELASRSWQGDLAALVTDWLGYWPWSQRSVHALGRDTDTPRAKSLVLSLAIWIVVAVLLAFAVLRLRAGRLLRVATAGVALGWLLLDLQWDAGLRWRHEATRTLYAGYAWPERERHSADSDIIETAIQLKAALRTEPDSTRILVHAGSSFALLRLVYHLLPMNVAVLAHTLQAATTVPIPDGSLIIVYDDDSWRYDSDARELHGAGVNLAGDAVLRRGNLLVVRYRSAP